MTVTPVPVAARSRLLDRRRLLGVDVARGIALIGMMSVHVMPSLAPDGAVTWAYRLFAGRASALFAVLAGLSLILALKGEKDAPPEFGARRGILGRAAVVAAVGLFLGSLGSGVAIILVHYAVLFAIGALFIGMGARPLLLTATAWMVLSPVVGHLLRQDMPAGPGASPSLASLADPGQLVLTILLTGYYPVLQWTGYVLVGMALGRLPLRRTAIGLWLLVIGVLLAVAAKLVSAVLLGPAGGLDRLTVPRSSALAGRELGTILQTGMYGTTPTSSWWWLAVSTPHSAVPLDLLHTTGTAVAVIGGCLVLVTGLRARWRWLVLPVAAAGSMTLTLYTLHVTSLAVIRGVTSATTTSPTALWAVSVVVAVLLALAWQLTGRRGPLENVASVMSAAARGGASAGYRSSAPPR
ncbi:heparan-alpha-glucosaminide N-acetyltransferase domain-containing protein [Georgenia sp. M64]|uniref:heparan-alpha-glucosaminide N-acetyltransferase domain-containing protein n=1 Tax=Georgenia sp. M64 TaxID=3120520 RepID=UPI0030E36326